MNKLKQRSLLVLLPLALVFSNGCYECQCNGNYPAFNEDQKEWMPDIQKEKKFFLNKDNDTTFHKISNVRDTGNPGSYNPFFPNCRCPEDKSLFGTYEEYIRESEKPLRRFKIKIEKNKDLASLIFTYNNGDYNNFNQFDDTISSLMVRGETYNNIFTKELDTSEIHSRNNNYAIKLYYSKKHGLIKYETNKKKVYEMLKD